MHTAQGSVFGQLLSDYARKRKQQKTGETPSRDGLQCFGHPMVHSLRQAGQSTQGEGVKIVARGDKWTMWFLGRELRFEKRMADTWGDEARWRLVTLFGPIRHFMSRCMNLLLLTLPTPHNAPHTAQARLYHQLAVLPPARPNGRRLHTPGPSESYTLLIVPVMSTNFQQWRRLCMQGLDDVANRMLRTTIPAESSLWYDPVRILRAIRFSRSHQLNFDSELEYAMENPELQVRAGR